MAVSQTSSVEAYKQPSWSEVLIKSFDNTYVADGVDVFEVGLAENQPTGLTRISTFLGLPNRILDKKKGQSINNLLLNLIGSPDNVSRTKQNINLLVSPLTLLLNVINVPFRILINVAKLGTEFLPLLLINTAGYLAIKLHLSQERPLLVNILTIIAMITNFAVTLASGLTYLLGYAITSPINSVKKAWHAGNMFGGISGKMVGGLLAGLSIAITFSAYAILFPLAIEAIATPILNAAAHLPSFVTTAINTITPAMTTFGHAIAPVVSWFATNLTLGILNAAALTSTFSAAAIGLGGMVGLAVTTIGATVSHFTDKLKNWWYTPVAHSTEKPAKSDKPIDNVGNSYQMINANLDKNKPEQKVVNEVKNDIQPVKQEAITQVQPIVAPQVVSTNVEEVTVQVGAAPLKI